MCLKNRIPVILLILLFAAACSTAPSTTGESSPLTGMVYDSEGRPVQGAQAHIDGKKEAVSDLNGRFVSPPLAFGPHVLLITKEGYEEQHTRIEFTSPLEVLYVSISSFESLVKKAEAALDQANYTEALSFIDRASTIYPDDPALMVLRCALYHQSGKKDAEAECLEKLKSSRLLDIK